MEVGENLQSGRSVQLNVTGEIKQGPESATTLIQNMVVQIVKEMPQKVKCVTYNSAQVIFQYPTA